MSLKCKNKNILRNQCNNSAQTKDKKTTAEDFSPAVSYIFSFAVLRVEISIFLISRQSSSKELPSLSVMYSDKIKSLNQYSVSAVSFKDI